MPAPARICGTIVHATVGAGRNASAAPPPASSSAPPSARAWAGPGSAAAASAATGRTETPSAARSGEIAKPATSSITSRNSTAVNAAVVNASAASERGSGSCSVLGACCVIGPRHAHAAARASGTCTTKIARQSNTSVRTPPIAGPAAVPMSAAPSHQRRPVGDSPASSAS